MSLDELKRLFISYKKEIIVASSILGGIIGTVFALKYRNKSSKNPLKKWEDLSQNNVILHISPTWNLGTPHVSPFASKIIAYFAYHKIEYIVDNEITTWVHPKTKKSIYIYNRSIFF